MLIRKGEFVEAVKLLTAPSDESNKKLMLGTSAARILQILSYEFILQVGHMNLMVLLYRF